MRGVSGAGGHWREETRGVKMRPGLVPQARMSAERARSVASVASFSLRVMVAPLEVPCNAELEEEGLGVVAGGIEEGVPGEDVEIGLAEVVAEFELVLEAHG